MWQYINLVNDLTRPRWCRCLDLMLKICKSLFERSVVTGGVVYQGSRLGSVFCWVINVSLRNSSMKHLLTASLAEIWLELQGQRKDTQHTTDFVSDDQYLNNDNPDRMAPGSTTDTTKLKQSCTADLSCVSVIVITQKESLAYWKSQSEDWGGSLHWF